MPSLLADTQSAGDVVGFTIALIAIIQASAWYLEREPGMPWFAAASLFSAWLVVSDGVTSYPDVKPPVESLLTMYAVRGLYALGLTAYLRLRWRVRLAAIAVLVLPAAAFALAIVGGAPVLHLTVALPLLWADFGMAALCLAWARREPGVGHGVLALAPLVGPCCSLIEPWRGRGLHFNQNSPAAAIGFGLVVLVVSLIRRSRARCVAQAQAEKMSSYYAALSQMNLTTLRIKEPAALYGEICRLCVESARAKMACVYLADGFLVRRAAAAGEAVQILERLASPWDIRTEEGRTSYTAEVLSRGERIVSNDYQNDPRAGPWMDLAVQHDVHAVAFLPLRRGGRTTATLMVGAGAAGFFDDALVRLLDEMTADISFALDNLDREARHRESAREVEAGLERFTRLFQAAPVASAIISVDEQRILDVNDAMCELHRATREQLIGRTTDSLAYRAVSEDRERFYDCLRQHGRIRNMPVRMTDGRRRMHVELMNAEPIEHLGKRCFIFMSLDITDMHAAEEARRALDEAQSASDAKTRFLSSISHELRTPLNAVLGFSGLLRLEAADRLTPGQLAHLDHVQQAGWHLLRLINDVLDLSRIEAGQFAIDMVAVELGALLDEAIQMSQPLASHGRIELHAVHPAGARTWALADPTRLRQVMLNLLSNGIKYNRADGQVRVAVSQHGGHARIEVEDTGIGMSAEQLAHLFEPFNRLGRDREGFEGTGIGLSLTRQLMHLMGGEVHVDSHEGRGTRIALTLPLAEAPQGEVRDAAEASTTRAEGQGAAPRGTVLYIEDNAVNSLLVEQLLARWPDVRFIRAMDGITGLEMARTLQPSLVLMDLQLPDIDGMELLGRLRSDATLAETPVIVLSASALPEDIVRARARGASDYWTKPLDFPQFLAGVARVLDGAPVD